MEELIVKALVVVGLLLGCALACTGCAVPKYLKDCKKVGQVEDREVFSKCEVL